MTIAKKINDQNNKCRVKNVMWCITINIYKFNVSSARILNITPLLFNL